MDTNFTKYSGAGNTFLFFDDRSMTFNNEVVPHLCKKENVDGVILLQDPLRMRIYNRDGSEAEMCGNGLRCFIRFIHELGLKEKTYTITTGAGKLEASLEGEEVAVKMSTPSDFRWNIMLDDQVIHYLNTGVPHVVSFVEEIDNIKIEKMGPEIRFHPYFMPQGTNVNFVSLKDGLLFVRTYERGVEAETLACGTGATASALAASFVYSLPSPITVIPLSKEKLTISFKRDGDNFSDVIMKGPTKKLSQGSISF